MECEEIERTFWSSFRLVPHNVIQIPATMLLTMRQECEVELNTVLFTPHAPLPLISPNKTYFASKVS